MLKVLCLCVAFEDVKDEREAQKAKELAKVTHGKCWESGALLPSKDFTPAGPALASSER